MYDLFQKDPREKTSPSSLLQSFQEGKPIFVNDLETGAFHIFPQLRIFKESLYKIGFASVTMTGSGTAFFCLGDLKNPSLKGMQFFLVSPVDRTETAWYQPV